MTCELQPNFRYHISCKYKSNLHTCKYESDVQLNEQPKQGRDPVQLTGTTWDHPRGYDCVVAASEAYAAETGVHIAWKKRSLQAFADAPISDLAEESDFIILDHPHIGQVSEDGALIALPQEDGEGPSLGGSAESYVWNGTCWAYAIDAACQMAAYRPDLANTLPKKWEQFLHSDAAQFRPLTPLLPVDAFDAFLTIVAGRGEECMPVSSQTFVSADNGEYALAVLRALYTLGPDEQVDMNPIAVLETLTSVGDFACSPCLFGYVNYTRSGFRPHRIAYFDLPVSEGFVRPRSILGGAGIGISSRTADPQTAIAFARWLSSESVQSGIYLANQGQPAHRGTWLSLGEDPDVSGFFRGGLWTMENAWTRPRDPWFLGFVDAVCAVMPDFFRKAIPADTFLATINALYRHHAGGSA